MPLNLKPEHRAFRDELRAFYDAHVEPGWRERHPTFDQLGPYLREWEAVLHAGGWSVPTWPRDFGGRGADAVERAIFTEETARYDAPEGLNRLGKRLVGPVLMQFGTPDQQRHLDAIRRGSEVWCQGFSEPDAGSDLLNIQTTAKRDGDEWVVNGRKIWTSFAQFADWVLLLVRTGSNGARGVNLSILLVDLSTPGIEIRPIPTISGHSEFNEVSLEDVRVPGANLVGDVDAGWAIVRSVLQDERGAEFCLARYSDIRRIFTNLAGSSKAHSGVAHTSFERLGEDYARVYAIQLLANDLLEREHAGTAPQGLESLVKLYTTEAWRTLGDHQVHHGGRVVFDDGGAQGLHDFFESRHYTISAGTSEIQRNLIASRLLGLPSARRA